MPASPVAIWVSENRQRPPRDEDGEGDNRQSQRRAPAEEAAAQPRKLFGRPLSAKYARVPQPTISEAELDQAENHSETGRGEAPVPVPVLSQRTTDQRPGERPHVDPHVEDREPGIPPRAPLRVEVGDHRTDVGLEQAGADDDQNQPKEEGEIGGHPHAEMPRGDDRAAHEHSLALSPELVGDPAAGETEQVDETRVEPVDGGAGLHIHPHPRVLVHRRLGHVEDEQRAHPVVGEALPHFREKEGVEPARMLGGCR